MTPRNSMLARLHGQECKIEQLSRENALLRKTVANKIEIIDLLNQQADELRQFSRKDSLMIRVLVAALKEIGGLVDESRQGKAAQVLRGVQEIMERGAK